MRALFEITLRRGWPQITARLLTLCKTVDQRLWAFEHPLKQFGRLSHDVLRKLEEGKLKMERLRDMRADEIGELGVTRTCEHVSATLVVNLSVAVGLIISVHAMSRWLTHM